MIAGGEVGCVRNASETTNEDLHTVKKTLQNCGLCKLGFEHDERMWWVSGGRDGRKEEEAMDAGRRVW